MFGQWGKQEGPRIGHSCWRTVKLECGCDRQADSADTCRDQLGLFLTELSCHSSGVAGELT